MHEVDEMLLNSYINQINDEWENWRNSGFNYFVCCSYAIWTHTKKYETACEWYDYFIEHHANKVAMFDMAKHRNANMVTGWLRDNVEYVASYDDGSWDPVLHDEYYD